MALKFKWTLFVQPARWTVVSVAAKWFSSALFLAIGISIHIDHFYDAGYGVQAAICAMSAAGVFLVDAVPLGLDLYRHRFALYCPRFCGAILAFLAALNWVLGETDGQWFPFLGPVLAVFALVILYLVCGLALASSIRPRQSSEHGGFTGEVCHYLGSYLAMCPTHPYDQRVLVPGDLFPSCHGHAAEWVAILR